MRPTKKLLLATIATLPLVFSACAITQKHEAGASSAVANNVEGGYLGTLGTGSTFQGYVFEKGTIDHYNALICLYGRAPVTINNESVGFVPPLHKSDGLQPLTTGKDYTVLHLGKVRVVKGDGLYLMDRQHARDYKLMRWWEDNGVPRQPLVSVKGLIQ